MAAGSVMPPTIVPLRTPEETRLAAGKQFVNTATPIELRSVTPGAEIYFTVDETRPEMKQRYGQKSTHHYTRPIRLLTGKQVIKAVARDRDERESAVVTKTFFVSYSEKTVDDPANPRLGCHSRMLSTSMPDLPERRERRTKAPGMFGSQGRTYQFLTGRVDKTMTISDLTAAEPKKPEERPQIAAQVLKKSQQTRYTTCAYCNGRRPEDPFSRFCPICSVPIPPLRRVSIPEAGELGQCIYCQNKVPVSAGKCLVCDAPMRPQLQPDAMTRLQRRMICTGCGMANPPELKVCVACETPLTSPIKEIAVEDPTAEVPHAELLPTYCRPCSRELAKDAKFCDTCGRQVINPNDPIVCGKCKANNNGSNIYCTGCGIDLVNFIPKLPTSRPAGADSRNGRPGKKDGNWLIVSPPKPPVPLKTQACQTDGLFYPSAKALANLKGAELDKLVGAVNSQDRANRDLTQISPGKGYWRQQTDHICSHIKAYSQNSADFQKAVGHPQMGRVLAATLRQEDKELTLSFTFGLQGKGGVTSSDGSPAKVTTFATTSSLPRASTPTSKLTEVVSRPATSGASLSGLLLASSGYDRVTATTGTSRPAVEVPVPKRSVTLKPRKRVKPVQNLSQSTDDCLLLRELGPGGEGRRGRVSKLLSEDASANCRDRQSLPALSVAAANGRVDCIGVLVHNGAKLNQQDTNGNSALHAAIVKGDLQVGCIEELLRCGMNADLQNKLGQTAYELAVARNLPPLIRCLASNVGTQLLAPLSKPRKRP